MEQNLS